MENLFEQAGRCLRLADPDEKLALSRETVAAWTGEGLTWSDGPAEAPIDEPGRLERPEIVAPGGVRRRGVGKVAGRAALLHALAHIELTAVNLAWDSIHRYRDLPHAYYDDWVTAAGEESVHFLALRERIRAMGYDYGSFPVHGALWETAIATAGDLMDRMAIVHRVLEARALDVVPRTIEKFRRLGDADTIRALEQIANDEVGHVRAGTRWFRHRCQQLGVEPDATFFELVRRHLRVHPRGPFNHELRIEAGFSEGEMQILAKLDTHV